jgi:AraC-like DNA-binding protein
MAGEKELARLEAALDGDVVVPESAAYDDVRKSPWAQYAHVRPLAVARCRTSGDVAEVIDFADGSAFRSPFAAAATVSRAARRRVGLSPT